MGNKRDYYEKYQASTCSALYDTVEISKRKYIVRLLKNKINQNSKIIDIGSGSGVLAGSLNTEAYFCIDIALNRIKLHSSYVKNKKLPNLSIQGDACNMPVKNNSFNVAFCIETLEHIEKDKDALREICRILKPGGTLLLTFPYDETITSEVSKKSGHINSYNKNKIEKLAQELDFKVENITFISRMVYYCWTLPKHMIYFLWLIATGRLAKRLNNVEIPSYYNTSIHRKIILPVSTLVLNLVISFGLAYTKNPYTFCGKAVGIIVVLEKQTKY